MLNIVLNQWERISLAYLKFSRDLVAFFFSMTGQIHFPYSSWTISWEDFFEIFLSLLLIIQLNQWERLQLRGLKFSSESDALSMNFRWIFFLHVLCYHINISLKFFLSLARLSSWICICTIYMNALVLQLLDWWKLKVLLSVYKLSCWNWNFDSELYGAVQTFIQLVWTSYWNHLSTAKWQW